MESRLHISVLQQSPEAHDNKDEPLWQDIRLLGRLLGDTIRDQEGDAVFNVVEQVRQQSVRFRRDENPAARSELEEILNQQERGHKIEIIQLFFPPREHSGRPASHSPNPSTFPFSFCSTRGHDGARASPRQ